MIRVFFLVLFSVLALQTFGSGQINSPSGDNPFLKFENTHIDLGAISKGTRQEMVYYFTNISNEEVQIDLVSSCECTDVEWSGLGIKPGEKSSIKATFDSSKKDKIETIDIDVILKNTDPESGNPVFIILNYSYTYIN